MLHKFRLRVIIISGKIQKIIHTKMFHKTKDLYRVVNSLKHLSSNTLRTHVNRRIIPQHALQIRSCSTINASPTFKRGIAQVAKQEKNIPFENVSGEPFETYMI